MDDHRIEEFERNLWIGEGDVYRRYVSEGCVLVVPERPFLLSGELAVEALGRTPRWSDAKFSDL
jgi:hypothetical protein